MKIFVFLFVALAIFSNVYSLECYSCSGELDYNNQFKTNDCEQFGYDDRYKKSQCLPGEHVCAKYIVQHDGIRIVHRSCKPFDICAFLQNTNNNPRNQLLECNTCQDRNFCNSSEKTRPALFLCAIFYGILMLTNKVY